MAVRISIELVLSNMAVAAAKEFNINIPEIAVSAVYTSIRNHIEAQENFNRLQDANLRERLRIAELRLREAQAIGQAEQEFHKDYHELSGIIRKSKPSWHKGGMHAGPLIIGS